MTRLTKHQPRPPIDFTPVPTRPRIDGWTVARQREFMATLAETGSLRMAAASVNMSESGAIGLRKRPGAESFADAWEDAISAASERIRDVMTDHALNGIPEPVFYQGKQVGERRRFNLRGQQWVVERGERGGRIAGAERQEMLPIPGLPGKFFPRLIPRQTREEMEESRRRLLNMMQRWTDAERRRMIGHIDTEEKRGAFELLFGPLGEYPFAPETWANMEAYTKVLVVQSLFGGAIANASDDGFDPRDPYPMLPDPDDGAVWVGSRKRE